MKKHLFSCLLLVCVMCVMAFPSSATQQLYCTTDIIHTECGDIEVETVLTVNNMSARSNYKSINGTQTFKYSGAVIAEVTLSATFGYDGKTAWVISASGSHTTYDGWSYGGEKITKSGGTAALTATLSKLTSSNVPVNISLTCSPTGEIS